jgi:uncharacterized membrane protein YeiB
LYKKYQENAHDHPRFGIQTRIPFSHWWMKRFKYGPAEWLWRSLTYLKPQPIKRQSAD